MKKITAICLLLALVVPALFACSSGDGGKTPAGTTAAGEDTAAVTTEAADPATVFEIPEDADYGGYDFRIYTYVVGASTEGGYSQMTNYNDLVAEEETGEPINDAVYHRNRAVEDKLNITITPVIAPKDQMTANLKASIQAGSAEYDTALQMIRAAQNMASENFLTNLYKVDTLHLDKAWWNDSIQKGVAINGNLFVITGDANIQDKEGLSMLFYNITLANDNGFDDIYTVIESGKWTLDEFWRQCSAVTRDLNGDSVINHEDICGTGMNYTSLNFFLNGAGESFATLKDGVPVSGLENERAISFIQKMARFMNDGNAMLLSGTTEGGWGTFTKMFKANNLLVRTGNLYNVKSYRDMEGDFSLICMPKYDEAQEQYFSPTSPHASTGFVIPITTQDTGRIGVILETMAHYSTDTILEAYVNITLGAKIMRNEKSVALLHQMIDTMIYDIGYVFNWASITSIASDSCKSSDSTIVSDYAKLRTSYLQAMQDTYNLYK